MKKFALLSIIACFLFLNAAAQFQSVHYVKNNGFLVSGPVKNGKHDGEWTGEIRLVDTLHNKEVYADGRMLAGESSDGKGNARLVPRQLFVDKLSI